MVGEEELARAFSKSVSLDVFEKNFFRLGGVDHSTPPRREQLDRK
jgi:hypothetical protein